MWKLIWVKFTRKKINLIVIKSENCARRCCHDDFDSCMSHDRMWCWWITVAIVKWGKKHGMCHETQRKLMLISIELCIRKKLKLSALTDDINRSVKLCAFCKRFRWKCIWCAIKCWVNNGLWESAKKVKLQQWAMQTELNLCWFLSPLKAW